MYRFAERLKTARLVFPKTVVAIFCITMLSLAPEVSYAQRGGGGGHFGDPGGHSSGGGRGEIHSSGGAHITYLPGSERPRPLAGMLGNLWPRSAVGVSSRSHLPRPIAHTGPFLPMIRGLRPQTRTKHLPYSGYGFWPLYWWPSPWIPDCGDPYWERDCRESGYYGDPDSNAQAQVGIESQESGTAADWEGAFNPVIFYLRDGTGYGATDYWLTEGMLHFVTTYGSEKSVGLEQLDVQRTVDENAARGVIIVLGSSPWRRSPTRMSRSTALACSPGSKETAGIAPSQASTGNEAGLFGASGHGGQNGLKVTSVETGSLAAQVGIHPGDVVLRIDCQQVHSSHDIESAIAANTSGTARVSYLIRGTWLTEQEIKVR
jgi:hypothetical protein